MPPNFRDSLRAFPRPYWALIGATFVTKFGVFVVPFLTLFMTKRGFTPAEAGMAVAAYSVGSFFASFVGGWLADRIGRNITMALSGFTGAACMLLLSQAEQLHWLVLMAMLAGFTGEANGPASVALVQDLIPKEHRLAAYAVQRFTVNLAWAIGPAVAGFLAEYSFFWLFAGDALSTIIFGFIALLWLPRGRSSPKETSGWSHALASIRVNRPYLALFVSCIAVAFIFRQSNTSFTLHFERSGHSMQLCGLVLALNGVMICLLEMPLTSLTRRLPVRPAIAAGYIGLGASYLVLVFGSSVAAFTLMMVIFTTGEMMAFSRQQAYAASLCPEDMRGRYSGFLGFAWSIGNISSSLLGLALYDRSPNALWMLTAVLGLFAAGVLTRASTARVLRVRQPAEVPRG